MRHVILLLILAGPQSAHAEGPPLVLRIRPPMPPAEIGGGTGALAPEEAARQAWMAREAVWERSRLRAEIAIASICTGCLREPPPPPAGGEAIAAP